MKSKLVMLIAITTLTLSAGSAMAANTKLILNSARGPVSVSKSARTAVSKKASRTAVPQPHTILNGAKHNY